MKIADEANVDINCVICDVFEIDMNKYEEYFDIVFMEGGISHYFHDINQFMKIMVQLLKPNGRMICSDFHPFQKISDILELQLPTMSYFSTDVFIDEMDLSIQWQDKNESIQLKRQE